MSQIRVYSSLFKLLILLIDCVGRYKNIQQFQSNRQKFNHLFLSALKSTSCRYLGHHPDEDECSVIEDQFQRKAAQIYHATHPSTNRNNPCHLM